MAIEPKPNLDISWADDAAVGTPDVAEPDLSAKKNGFAAGYPIRWWFNYWMKAVAARLRWMDRVTARQAVGVDDADAETTPGLYAGGGVNGGFVMSAVMPKHPSASQTRFSVTAATGFVIGLDFLDAGVWNGACQFDPDYTLATLTNLDDEISTATTATTTATDAKILSLRNALAATEPVQVNSSDTHKQWVVTAAGATGPTELYGRYKNPSAASSFNIPLGRRFNGDEAQAVILVSTDQAGSVLSVTGKMQTSGGGSPSSLLIAASGSLPSGVWIFYRIIAKSTEPL